MIYSISDVKLERLKKISMNLGANRFYELALTKMLESDKFTLSIEDLKLISEKVNEEFYVEKKEAAFNKDEADSDFSLPNSQSNV